MRIRYSARALADIRSIYSYLVARNPQGARHVMQALRSAVENIGDNPEASPATNLRDVRVKRVTSYPYRVFYRAAPDGIDVLHIRHAARRPLSIERHA